MAPTLTLIAEQMEQIGCNVDQLIRYGNLTSQGGFLNGRHHNVRRQGEIGCLELEALVVRLGLQQFHRSPRTTKNIRRVGNLHLAGEKIVELGFLLHSYVGSNAVFLPTSPKSAVDARKERTLSGGRVRPRDAQRRLRRGKVGIVLQRSFDEGSELP